MGKTKIQWTNATWNPTRGCSLVSPGCRNCYAMKFAHRFSGKGRSYAGLTRIGNTGPVWTGEVRTVPAMLDYPLRLRKPHQIFVNSTSDLFHKDVPNEYIAAVFGVIAACQQHTFQILTKRAERLPEWFAWLKAQMPSQHPHGATRGALWYAWNYGRDGNAIDRIDPHRDSEAIPWPLPNVWLGVSVENQEYADARIPHLLRTPAAVRFLSCEPLLGPVNLHFGEPLGANEDSAVGFVPCCGDARERHQRLFNEPCWRGIGWVIVGGESGAGARPMDLAWARSIVEQCKAAGVPAFVKQLGARPAMDAEAWRALSPSPLLTPRGEDPIVKGAGLVQLAQTDRAHGGDPAEWPANLRVREFPNSEGRT